MSDTKDNILKVDGVSDILMEVSKLRAERDLYKEKYNNLLHFTIKNTRIGFRGLAIEDSDEFNFMLKFLAPEEYRERYKVLRQKEKAEQEAEAREEANNE